MKTRVLAGALAGLCLICLGGCATGRTVVITNTSDQPYELRRDGAATAITVDPGGSASLEIGVGEVLDLGDTIIRVY